MALQQLAQYFGIGPKKPCKTALKLCFFRANLKFQIKIKDFSWNRWLSKFFPLKSFWSILVLKKCKGDWPNPAGERVKV